VLTAPQKEWKVITELNGCIVNNCHRVACSETPIFHCQFTDRKSVSKWTHLPLKNPTVYSLAPLPSSLLSEWAVWDDLSVAITLWISSSLWKQTVTSPNVLWNKEQDKEKIKVNIDIVRETRVQVIWFWGEQSQCKPTVLLYPECFFTAADDFNLSVLHFFFL